ncbi:MAG: tRNA-ribosyltransferase, partial [Halobacteria archaeon]|nr:tRNA-ribosyltransferase [Halobacteria archaeon]
MTQYFEVIDRDATALLGELRLDDAITTPALVGDLIEDYGSLWTDERETPDGDSSVVSLFPHRAAPSGTPGEVVDEKQTEYVAEEVAPDFPSATVVSVEKPEPTGHDLYVLTGLQRGRSRNLVEGVMGARRSLEPDSALMLPGVATPRNVAILSYLGVDAFDEDYAVVKGKDRVYMTRELEIDVGELDELPCACSVCADSEPGELSHSEIAEHNVSLLRAELANVRDKIRNGNLREYVEGQVRHARWQVETMRLVDQELSYVEERTPVVRQSNLMANSSETLDRV